MSNLYNAKVHFRGEGSFTFTMPFYGEVTIFPGKDIYMKNLTQQGVETLRSLRPMLLDHQLNAKSDGCYSFIDFNDRANRITPQIPLDYRTVQSQPKSVAEMKSEMVKGPIIEEETIENVKDTEEIEKVKEDIVKIEDYVLTSTKHKGKKLSELTKGQISGNMKRFNEADLKVVKEYIK